MCEACTWDVEGEGNKGLKGEVGAGLDVASQVQGDLLPRWDDGDPVHGCLLALRHQRTSQRQPATRHRT